MVRRNPDALAIGILGLFLLIANVPRFLLQRADWAVRPVKMEVRIPPEDLRVIHDEVRAHREEIRRQAEELKRTLRDR